MSIPLWEIETSWFLPKQGDIGESNYTYASWKDFMMCKPYKFWKPYVLSSWSWKKVNEIPMTLRRQTYEDASVTDHDATKLQIVFLSSSRFQGVTCVEMFISKNDENEVREWLKNHMPKFWKI